MCEKRQCVIGYKIGRMENSGFLYGALFDNLKSCCKDFEYTFLRTGNKKVTSFSESNDNYDAKPGFNFIVRGELKIILVPCYTTDSSYGQIHFCPFCGAEIVVKQTKSVLLMPKIKTIPDGYREEILEETP